MTMRLLQKSLLVLGVVALLFLLGQLLLSYLLPDRAQPPDEPHDRQPEAPAARWPRPVRPPKVTRRLILPRTDPYAPRPFVVYRRPLRLTRPIGRRPVVTSRRLTTPRVNTHPITR